MAYGWQVLDASGNITTDHTNYLGTFLGVTTLTAGTNGSVTNAGFSLGTPYWHAIPTATFTQIKEPTLSVSGTTLSWTWPSSPGTATWKLVYGVY